MKSITPLSYDLSSSTPGKHSLPEGVQARVFFAIAGMVVLALILFGINDSKSSRQDNTFTQQSPILPGIDDTVEESETGFLVQQPVKASPPDAPGTITTKESVKESVEERAKRIVARLDKIIKGGAYEN